MNSKDLVKEMEGEEDMSMEDDSKQKDSDSNDSESDEDDTEENIRKLEEKVATFLQLSLNIC